MFQNPLVVEALPEVGMWKLVQTMRYMTHRGDLITVPVGFRTDLASIPAFFTPVLPINDLQRPAAVVHDWLYSVKEINGKAIVKDQADEILYEAMLDLGEKTWRAHAIWWGVHLGGFHAWNKDRPEKLSMIELNSLPKSKWFTRGK